MHFLLSKHDEKAQIVPYSRHGQDRMSFEYFSMLINCNYLYNKLMAKLDRQLADRDVHLPDEPGYKVR